jgi:hypothetical protein
VVGLVVPDVGNSFYSTVAHALAETTNSHEHQVMLCETGIFAGQGLQHRCGPQPCQAEGPPSSAGSQ